MVSPKLLLFVAPCIILISFTAFGLSQDNSTSANNSSAPVPEDFDWSPIPQQLLQPENITLNSTNFEEIEKEVATEIRKEGKNWVADVSPEFANITDFGGLLGGVIVLPPPPAPPPGPNAPPPSQRPTTDGHPLKRRKLPPKRHRSVGGSQYDLEDDDPRFKNLPARYDLRWDYPECTSISSSIRSQLGCNGCWAFCAGSVICDRHCIYNYPATGQLYFSTMELLSCVPYSNGCNGGREWDAFKYWVKKGLVSGGTAYREAYQPDGCLPVPANVASQKLTCPTACSTSYYKPFDKDRIYGGEWYYWWFPSVEIIKREIYKYGPVTALFIVNQDFFTYRSGVYEPTTQNVAGAHNVKLIGWGTEGGVDYWLAVNSWGTNWGERGVFKVRRGINTCQVEARIGGVLPKEGVDA